MGGKTDISIKNKVKVTLKYILFLVTLNLNYQQIRLYTDIKQNDVKTDTKVFD